MEHASRPKRSRTSRAISGPWECPRCTYFNKVRIWSNAECQMCDSPRSGPIVCPQTLT
jgi:hypothetical protein